MRSRAVRLTLLLLFVAAVGVTAYLFWNGESRARADLQAARLYEQRAIAASREAVNLRASQQAYVAAGQGEQFWGQRVTAGLAGLQAQLAALRADSTAAEAQAAVDAAATSLRDFEQMDRRARDYARNGQHLLASDIIFADGLDLTSDAAASLDTARTAETEARTAALAAVRNRQLFALGAAAAAALLVIVLLVPQARRDDEPDVDAVSPPALAETRDAADGPDLGAALDEGWSSPKLVALDETPAAATAAAPGPIEAVATAGSTVALDSVASLCTDLARLVDTRSLPSMLERAATALDASGIVLWIADPDGRELSPIVTHGYPPNVVNRLGTILRDDQNAAAAAFRTSLVQTVKTDAVSNGAIAAPLVIPGGSVGVMAAEVRHHGEQDPSKLAIAAIVAAQLATLVGPPTARSQNKAEVAG